jgi:hypothetical protein
MQDLYLKFADEASLAVAFEKLPLDRYCSLDVIGEIEGATGWHANLRLAKDRPDIVAALASVTIEAPTTPYRVWL